MASSLLLREEMNDVVVQVRHEGFNWRMPAHSLLLINKSQAFQEMMDERGANERPALLTLVGVKPETALAVLKYVYKNEYPADATADLLIASRRYGLEDLCHNLEENITQNLSLEQACDIFEELHERQPMDVDCCVKSVCQELIEMHALTVFGSDLVLRLGKMALTNLLMSDHLNVPDEAYVFWAVWRWGRMQSSKHERSLQDMEVESYIDDLIVLIRGCSLRCRDGIPSVASVRFDRCKGRRTLYTCPPDIMNHSFSLRPCPAFEDIVPSKPTENPVCLQISVEKDAMLVGVSLEMCNAEGVNSFIHVKREADCVELRRAKVCWCQTSLRRTNLRGDPEYRLEAEVTFHQPVFLTPGNIYSIQMSGDFGKFFFVWGSIKKRRMKIGNTFVNFHGESVTALREVHLIPDLSVTWGPRGPAV